MPALHLASAEKVVEKKHSSCHNAACPLCQQLLLNEAIYTNAVYLC